MSKLTISQHKLLIAIMRNEMKLKGWEHAMRVGALIHAAITQE